MSAYWDILQAVKLACQSLPGVMGVAVRKRPYVDKRVDRFPFVCLSPKAEKPAGQQFGNGLWVDYPVVITLVTPSDFDVENNIEWVLAAREMLRLTLWKPQLGGVPAVFDSDYNPNPAFDLSALDNTIDASLQEFTFRTAEARSN